MSCQYQNESEYVVRLHCMTTEELMEYVQVKKPLTPLERELIDRLKEEVSRRAGA